MSQRTVMPYSATPPKPAIARSSSDSYRLIASRTGAKGARAAVGVDAREVGRQRLDLEPVDADHRVAVVHEVVGEAESGRAHADHQHPVPARARAAAAGGR